MILISPNYVYKNMYVLFNENWDLGRIKIDRRYWVAFQYTLSRD